MPGYDVIAGHYSIMLADVVTSCPLAAARFSEQGKALDTARVEACRQTSRPYLQILHCRCTSIHDGNVFIGCKRLTVDRFVYVVCWGVYVCVRSRAYLCWVLRVCQTYTRHLRAF